MKGGRGFTLIELLVVIAIIGLLASIILASVTSARQKAKVTRAKAELYQIRAAFEMFMTNNGDYPPVGADHCDMCWVWPPAFPWASGQWIDIVNLLRADNVIPPQGFEVDPWGNAYVYDKNYKQSCFMLSPICSRGPNGTLETTNCQVNPIVSGDDVCIFISDD